jgi:hypothetical protein
LTDDRQIQPRNLDRILIALFLLTLPLVNPWVRGDGIGYYAYARAPLIQHNLDFTADYQAANQSFREGRLDAEGKPLEQFRTPTGHLENHFTVGPGILWSPFLLLAHAGVLLARSMGSHVAADGFSAPYRYALALSTALYGFLSVFISFRMARKYVAPLWAFLASISIWLASSLPVYMYFNPSWSHAHSAFSVALFLYYWDATRERRGIWQWFVLALVVGLMLNVYYANLMVCAVLIVEALPQYVAAIREWRNGSSFRFGQLVARHLLFGATVFVCLSPTFVSRWIVYGGPFRTGYIPLSSFLWHSPVFLSVLFSANHGLLSWTPLVGFAFVGLILFAVRFPKPGIAMLTGAVCFYIFISIYPDWAGVSSYGNRFFVSLTAPFVCGLAMLLERLAGALSRQRAGVPILATILLGFVLWNFGLIYQWGTHLIPARGPISFRQAAYNQFNVVPQQMSAQLRNYLFRRSALMQQLEQKDEEQRKKKAQP